MSSDRDRWYAPRWGVLLLALVQFVGPVGLQAADAILDGHDYSTSLHIESEGHEDCSGGHSHLICQTIRSLAAGLATTDVVDGVSKAGPEHAMIEMSRSDISREAAVSGALGSRAPPLA